MTHYRVVRPSTCQLEVERGALARVGQLLNELAPHARIHVVTDRTVASHYLGRLEQSLRSAGVAVLGTTALDPGERSKSLDCVSQTYDDLYDSGFARRDVIIALGGGVISDLAGFVAASFMRGVPYVNVPTTVIAQVDAAIGGKVGVNLRSTKNLIGGFHHPIAVIVDPDTLATLPRRHVCAGLAEAVKVALIGSPELFSRLRACSEELLAADADVLLGVVQMAIDVKLSRVLPDPFEEELDRELNLGHTVSHALEAVVDAEELLHGEAVGIGLATAAQIAVQRGVCDTSTAVDIRGCLQAFGLATDLPRAPSDIVWREIERVRLARNRRTRWVLPERIGKVQIRDDVTEAEFASAWQELSSSPA